MKSPYPMEPSDEDLEAWESQIPELAAKATEEAYNRARQAGLSVTMIKGTWIVSLHPDGSADLFRTAKPRRRVKIGNVISAKKTAKPASSSAHERTKL
jgi:hypothetical protein